MINRLAALHADWSVCQKLNRVISVVRTVTTLSVSGMSLPVCSAYWSAMNVRENVKWSCRRWSRWSRSQLVSTRWRLATSWSSGRRKYPACCTTGTDPTCPPSDKSCSRLETSPRPHHRRRCHRHLRHPSV